MDEAERKIAEQNLIEASRYRAGARGYCQADAVNR
jgi:hypothetical protein